MCIKKHKCTPKTISMIVFKQLVCMKVEIILNHFISHNMNHVWIPCDSFANFHLKKCVF